MKLDFTVYTVTCPLLFVVDVPLFGLWTTSICILEVCGVFRGNHVRVLLWLI